MVREQLVARIIELNVDERTVIHLIMTTLVDNATQAV